MHTVIPGVFVDHPDGHVMQEAEPLTLLYLFVGHAAHNPPEAANSPGSQSMHTLAPSGDDCPSGHGVHEAAFFTLLHFPAGQRVQANP